MAFRDTAQPALSRRALLRHGGSVAAGAALAALPGGPLLSRASARAAPSAGAALPWPGLTRAMERYVRERKVANMVATLGWGQRPDPQVIARGRLTFTESAPAGADSLYRIYSMTKPLTGMIAMMLIDEGRLGLDQPVAEILPAFATMRVQKTYDGAITPDALEPAARPITIRMLLTHSAGLGYSIIQSGPIKAEYERLGLTPGQVTRLPLPTIFRAPPAPSLEIFADRLATVPLVAQPGTRWSYSVGLDLMGRVIEVVEGKPFDTAMRERLLDPLDMRSTFFRVPRGEIGRLTGNYVIIGGVPIPIDRPPDSIYLDRPAFPFGGAGLVSSPRDYDRFLRMLLGHGRIDGKRVMGELAVRVGTSDILPPTVSIRDAGPMGITAHGAGGIVKGSVFGWGGAAGTTAFADFGTGLRAQLFTQYMPNEVYPIQTEFSDLVQADLARMQDN